MAGLERLLAPVNPICDCRLLADSGRFCKLGLVARCHQAFRTRGRGPSCLGSALLTMRDTGS